MMMQLNGYKGNNMSLGGSSSSSQQLDPKLRDLYLKNYQSAQNVASQLGPRQFQGFTPDQQTAFGVTRQFADPNSQQMQQLGGAANIAKQAGGYQAEQVRGGSLLNQDIGAYMNPYTQAVTQQGLQDINRSRQLQQQQTAAQATAAKAFGGSRQGVAEAETNRAFDENALRFIGQQNAQAFQAAQAGAESDLARQQQAILANQQAGLQANQQRLSAAGQVANIAGQGQQMGFAGANQLAQQGLLQQGFTQQQIDALRNLPLEQQQIINQAMGINVAGGSGMQQSSSSGQGLFGLFR
jgi:hypothetical protein